MVDLAALLAYMRLDDDLPEEDERLIEDTLWPAAEEYLDGAGVPAPTYDSPLYDLAVKGLVCHWYEHREAMAYYRSEIPLGVRAIINQMKLRGGGTF